MFRLNRLTDYGVVVMTQMAQGRPEVVTATQLAASLGLPTPTVAKLLTALTRGGLVISQRGASGGYRLSRAPAEISVAAIIQALEGPIALTACVHGSDEQCEVEALCPMSGNWNRVNEAIRGALEGVSLADMASHDMAFMPPAPAPTARAEPARKAS